MKILQVNNVYKKGSTGKIVYDIHSELIENKIDSIVCFGRGKEIHESHLHKICPELYSKINHFLANVTGVMYGGCFFSTKKLIRIIKKENPDIVHLQCLNGYFINIYYLIRWLKTHNIKTVLTLHAEFMYTGGCAHAYDCVKWKDCKGCNNCPRWKAETQSYFVDRTNYMWKKMYNAFSGFDDNLAVVSVSPWLMGRAKESSILKEKNNIAILNGLDTKIFNYREKESSQLKAKLKINRKVIFHVTPKFSLDSEHIKGGSYVYQLAKTMNNTLFIIAGDYPNDIIFPANMLMLGKITDQNVLAAYYSLANITLLTSKRETFSMVVAESQCCGTPVIGFKAGAPEQIALSEYSSFVDYGDMVGLKNKVLQWLMNEYDPIRISNEAKEKYSKSKMCNQYIELYKSILQE